ncbi:hypothetical protein V1512DRAFT_247971 [Lipomyces arxii]|uniref:uncharacterized protein n=1 Tax=Lipomyces arxii TaxID=56418 RepID=UPI0034CE874F
MAERRISRKSNLRTSVVASVVIVALLASSHYLFSRWISQYYSQSDTGSVASRTENKKKLPVVVVLSKTILESSLLTPSLKDQVDLVLLYPTDLRLSEWDLNVERLKDLVAHPSRLFFVSKNQSINPILRHLAIDDYAKTTVFVADDNVDIANDNQITRYVGNIVFLPDVITAPKIWSQHIID